MGTTYNSTVVDAPIEKVWATVRNFYDLAWTQMNLTVKAVNDLKPDQIGASRIINDVFHETLTDLNDFERSFAYHMTDGPDAVAKDKVKSFYGKLQLFAITDEDKTYALWTTTYDAPDNSAVGEFVNPIYQAALKGLKKTLA